MEKLEKWRKIILKDWEILLLYRERTPVQNECL